LREILNYFWVFFSNGEENSKKNEKGEKFFVFKTKREEKLKV
jgi:hypothetical protein